jgi:glycerophosphoryl diester phosphodiesterase
MMNKALLLTSSIIFASAVAVAQAPANTTQTTAQKTPQIAAIAHRGEHLHHPENTIPAFQAAIDAGADYFEADIRTTSDRKLVIMHDETADRTTNGSGPISNMTMEQVRALDAGAKFSKDFAGTHVPTFDEILDLAHGKIGVYVDTKEADPLQLVQTIERHDMQHHVVIYGDPFLLYDIHKLRPTWKVMPEAVNEDLAAYLVSKLSLQVLAFDAGDFNLTTIQIARKANALVYVDRLGSSDNPEAWSKAIEMGANGIQSNHPAELVQFLRSRGLHS